jgi:hypothetical protein
MAALTTETLAISHDLRLTNTHCFGGRSCHCLQAEHRKGESYSGGTIDTAAIGRAAFQRACHSRLWPFPTTLEDKSRSSLQNPVGYWTLFKISVITNVFTPMKN